MIDIQSAINELSNKTDTRTSVFEVEVQGLKNSTLTGLYEKPTFGQRRSSELTYGTVLEVLDAENQWVFARQHDGYLGWVYRPYLSQGAAPHGTHLVVIPATEVRAQPGDACEVVTRLVSGTGVHVEENLDGWSRITANRPGWIPTRHLRAIEALPVTLEQKRLTLVEDAKRMLGVPYLWGGASGNGIDCSGFVRLLHRYIGIEVPRDADMQHTAAYPVEPPYEAGDLFFFKDGEGGRKITHVGMSVGGWNMIHSSRRNNGVYIDNLQEQSSLMSTFVNAGSLLR